MATEENMTKVQKVYRELRKYLSKEDSRYAAPRLAGMTLRKD